MLIGSESGAVFLDEFQMMVYSLPRSGRPYELVFFNTSTRQDDPTNPRRLRFPQKYSYHFLVVRIDPEVAFGRSNQEDPLIIDPTQAFLALKLWGGHPPGNLLLLLRTQTLITHACSTSENAYISWNELGRDAVLVELPSHRPFLAQGLHIFTEPRIFPDDYSQNPRIRIFNFRRWGSNVPRDGSFGTLGTDWHEEGQDFLFQGYHGGELDSLGDGLFYKLVSHFHRYKTSGMMILSKAPVFWFGLRAGSLGVDLRHSFRQCSPS